MDRPHSSHAHCASRGKLANLDIVNVFRSGKGQTISFPATGFEVKECFVDGEPVNLATHISDTKQDRQHEWHSVLQLHAQLSVCQPGREAHRQDGRPFYFCEIAHQHLNQTLVRLWIEDV